ncbi:MAG: hypothetical protein HOJ49_00985 [Nitrospina sp.]|nr:hypothetical protein [Nitrospina sp.]
MQSLRFGAIISLAFLLMIAQDVFAHGGTHKPKEKEVESVVPPAMDSMYSVKETEPGSLSLDNMFSPSDLFVEGEVVSSDPMAGMKTEGSHNEQMEHQESQIEIARHKQVSSSSKGYGTAIGITLFAGLAFAGLTFMRPGE